MKPRRPIQVPTGDDRYRVTIETTQTDDGAYRVETRYMLNGREVSFPEYLALRRSFAGGFDRDLADRILISRTMETS